MKRSMAATLFRIGLLVLFFLAAALSIFLFIQWRDTSFRLGLTRQSLTEKTGLLDQARAGFSAAQNDLTRAQGELDQARSDLASTRTLLQQTQDESTRAREELAVLQTQHAALKEQFTQTRRELLDQTVQNDRLVCDDVLKMDYSSVMAATSRLMSYVDGLRDVDHVSTGFRNTLWSNADSKIYGINYVADDKETYSMQFLVYFNEFGMHKSVFYVDGQCWLDLPE